MRQLWRDLRGWHERVPIALGTAGAAVVIAVAVPPFLSLVRLLFVGALGAEPDIATTVSMSFAPIALLVPSAVFALVLASLWAALARYPVGFAGLTLVFSTAAIVVLGDHARLPLPIAAPLAAMTTLGALCSLWSALSTARADR